MTTTGRRLRAARIMRGITGKELARQLGVHESTVLRYETGAFQYPPVDRLIMAGLVLDVDPLWILASTPKATSNEGVNNTLAYLVEHLDDVYCRVLNHRIARKGKA